MLGSYLDLSLAPGAPGSSVARLRDHNKCTDRGQSWASPSFPSSEGRNGTTLRAVSFDCGAATQFISVLSPRPCCVDAILYCARGAIKVFRRSQSSPCGLFLRTLDQEALRNWECLRFARAVHHAAERAGGPASPGCDRCIQSIPAFGSGS